MSDAQAVGRSVDSSEAGRLSTRLTLLSRGLTSLPRAQLHGGLLELNLHGNAISSLNPGDFSGLSNLMSLNLSGNDQRSLRGLPALPALVHLDVSGNQLTSLDGISALPNLRELLVSYNSISSLFALSEFAGFRSPLRVLDVAGNAIEDFTSLACLTKIRTLECLVVEDSQGGDNPLSHKPLEVQQMVQAFGSKLKTGTANLLERGYRLPIVHIAPKHEEIQHIEPSKPAVPIPELSIARLNALQVKDNGMSTPEPTPNVPPVKAISPIPRAHQESFVLPEDIFIPVETRELDEFIANHRHADLDTSLSLEDHRVIGQKHSCSCTRQTYSTEDCKEHEQIAKKTQYLEDDVRLLKESISILQTKLSVENSELKRIQDGIDAERVKLSQKDENLKELGSLLKEKEEQCAKLELEQSKKNTECVQAVSQVSIEREKQLILLEETSVQKNKVIGLEDEKRILLSEKRAYQDREESEQRRKEMENSENMQLQRRVKELENQQDLIKQMKEELGVKESIRVEEIRAGHEQTQAMHKTREMERLAEISALEERNNTLQTTVTSLEKQTQEQSVANRDLEARREQTQTVCAEQEQVILVQEKKIEQQEVEKSEAASEQLIARDWVVTLSEYTLAHRSQFHAAKDRVRVYESERQEMMKRIDKLKFDLNEERLQNIALQHQTQEKEHSDVALHGLQKVINTLYLANIVNVPKKLTHKQQSASGSLSSQFEQDNSVNEQDTHTKLQLVLDNLHSKINKANDDNTQLRTVNEELRAVQLQTERRNNELTTKADHDKNELEQCSLNLEVMSERNIELTEQVQVLQTKLQDVREQLDQFDLVRNKLDSMADLVALNNEFKQKILHSDTENTRLQAEVVKMCQQKTLMDEKIYLLTNQLQDQQTKQLSLETQLKQKSDADLMILREENIQLQTKLNVYTQQAQQFKDDLNEKNFQLSIQQENIDKERKKSLEQEEELMILLHEIERRRKAAAKLIKELQ